jgi:choline dehydrogenase
MTPKVTSTDFDTLIIGAGVAGCVLAARLSADPARTVCLVEAGPDYGPDRSRWPEQVRDARVLPRDNVWETESAPFRLRAKMLGGSSCINGCWHTWGSEQDYAEWSSVGGQEWSASGLEPYRRAAVEMMRLRTIPAAELSVWSAGALAAAEDLGYPEVPDLAAPGLGPGYGCPPVNAVGDLRWNAAWAYLDPIRDRPNLRIHSGATALRLVMRGAAVRGVEIDMAGERITLGAEHCVLAAGTYGSPALLLRSGIGPAADLAELGVDVTVDLPGVGANLIDHPCVVLPLKATTELNSRLADKEAAGELYASQVAVKAATEFCPDGAWDLHLLPTAGPPLFGSLPAGEYEVGIAAFLMKPASRGVLRLRSADPDVPVHIDPALLTDPAGQDLAMGRTGLRLAADLAAAPALKVWAGPTDTRDPAQIPDSELRDRAGTYWHPVGTCAMGGDDDPMAVVDPHGRVRGMDNLHVIDASILPTAPAANTQLPTLAVAEMLVRGLR